MKKILAIGGLIAAIGAGSAFVYADSPIGTDFRNKDVYNKERSTIMKEHHNYRKESLKEDLKNGYITEEEAKKWEEHYDYMEEFHNENGYGGCHGGRGMMRGRRGRS